MDIKRICEAEYPQKKSAIASDERPIVSASIVRDVISEACGIPSSMIRKTIDYDELEKRLMSVVLGQDEGIKRLVSVIKRSDLGFGKTDRPRGIFMFVGESGVGKTALAIELEKALFYDVSGLLRFDMSEYSEKQSISKLIGSPPGYVGHEEGGALTEAVRRRPHAVILFDEIEKADKEILNILLQIADYGYLTDALGRHVSFRNAIVIATTNIGASGEISTVGFENNGSTRQKSYITLLKKYYKEELINRFDEIIVFAKLDHATLRRIVTEKLELIKDSLAKKGYTLAYDAEVVEHIVEKGEQRGLGARPSLRDVSALIEDKIIDMIIQGCIDQEIIRAEIRDGEIVISPEKSTLKMT